MVWTGDNAPAAEADDYAPAPDERDYVEDEETAEPGLFLLVFIGGAPVAADRRERASRWSTWFDSLGDSLLDRGWAVLGGSASVAPDGSVSDHAQSGLTGYTIVSTASLAEALELATGCPALDTGAIVDVLEMREDSAERGEGSGSMSAS